jgi:PTS system mannose-specific IIB component
MAVVHARVDERLIHGQVAMVWTNMVGASRIIVVNDKAVKDEMIIAGLKMAKPAGVKLSILSKKRAVEKFAEDAYKDDKVFLITQNIQDMAYLIHEGLKISGINVGNVAKREGSRQIKKSVNLTEQDITDIKKLIDAGITVTAQMLPNESDQTILNFL